MSTDSGCGPYLLCIEGPAGTVRRLSVRTPEGCFRVLCAESDDVEIIRVECFNIYGDGLWRWERMKEECHDKV